MVMVQEQAHKELHKSGMCECEFVFDEEERRRRIAKLEASKEEVVGTGSGSGSHRGRSRTSKRRRQQQQHNRNIEEIIGRLNARFESTANSSRPQSAQMAYSNSAPGSSGVTSPPPTGTGSLQYASLNTPYYSATTHNTPHPYYSQPVAAQYGGQACAAGHAGMRGAIGSGSSSATASPAHRFATLNAAHLQHPYPHEMPKLPEEFPPNSNNDMKYYPDANQYPDATWEQMIVGSARPADAEPGVHYFRYVALCLTKQTGCTANHIQRPASPYYQWILCSRGVRTTNEQAARAQLCPTDIF
jgi:hypothetical protein